MQESRPWHDPEIQTNKMVEAQLNALKHYLLSVSSQIQPQ